MRFFMNILSLSVNASLDRMNFEYLRQSEFPIGTGPPNPLFWLFYRVFDANFLPKTPKPRFWE